MGGSLRASTQGLEIVDRARRNKGWSRQASAWYQTALTSQATLKRFLQGEPIQPETFIRICQAVGLERWQEIVDSTTVPIPLVSPKAPTKDWGEAPDISVFYGRTEELATLEQWIVKDSCRLVALLGMGGIGKTALSVRLAEQIQNQFEYVVWRSLRYAPPIEDVLVELIRFLSNEEQTNFPEDTGRRVSLLIQYLRSHRCLLVLDEVETILRSGAVAGQYREGYEGYGELLKRVAEQQHNSCLVLTSQEKPKDLASQEGDTRPVRSLQLDGLKEAEARQIFIAKGLSDTDKWKPLYQIYKGNPFVLKIVSAAIKETFDGKVSDFLKLNTIFIGDIYPLLASQFERLSPREKEIMYRLAAHPTPISILTLKEELSSSVPTSEVIEALVSLARRSLIEKHIEDGEVVYTLQPVIRKYVTIKYK